MGIYGNNGKQNGSFYVGVTQCLGCRIVTWVKTGIKENQMDKKLEHDMEPGVILGLYGVEFRV